MKYITKGLKIFLFMAFFSYYIVALALAYPWINTHIQPLKIFNLEKITQLKPNIYLSTYPTKKHLKNYQINLSLERVILLLNPSFPISRELVKKEEEVCKELGLELIIIPISYFSTNPMDFMLIKILLDEDPKVTLVHTYFYDNRLKLLENILKADEKI